MSLYSAHPRRRLRFGLAPVLAAGLTVLVGASVANAATYTVSTTGNAGFGSLRQAILDANANAGFDDIDFAIAGAGPNPHIINLASDLPTITDQVRVRGYTQPGAVKATALVPATVKIVINAADADNGLVLQADDSDIRGIVVWSAGRLSGASPPDGDGIRIIGDRNRVIGSYVGIDRLGTSFVLGNNGDGIEVTGNENAIGGTAAGDRNVISANGLFAGFDSDGVTITGDQNTVEGNTIGPDPAGTNGQIGNRGAGVRVAGDSNHVGGSAATAGNVISANGQGVVVASGTDNRVRSNLVGTDVSGAIALGNSDGGIIVEASGNSVGNDLPGDGNVISGTFTGAGLHLLGDDNAVEGNMIGTDGAGSNALGNTDGIVVEGDRNTIGGTTAEKANVISGNLFDGIELHYGDDPTDAPSDNVIAGNFIGTDVTGASALPNGDDGVRIEADRTTVGGTTLGSGNTISNNGGEGVSVASGAGNMVGRNAIFANGGLGIDLGADGTTANDGGDVDTGANGLANTPIITAANVVAGPFLNATAVQWTLDTQAGNNVRVEFYRSPSCDASGGGEGQTYLGSQVVTIDAFGHSEGTQFFAPIAAGQVITATATSGVAAPGPPFLVPVFTPTSEFSPCTTVV